MLPGCMALPHSRVAPATPERQVQLDEERRLLAEMRPHKRKLYLLQRQKVRSAFGESVNS